MKTQIAPVSKTIHEFSNASWQILGELELPVGPKANGMVEVWLTETLGPLKLQADFMGKVMQSTQEAVDRTLKSEGIQREFEHFHLRVFINVTSVSKLRKGQTWGFFRIEKIEISTEDEISHAHSLEYYLYLEG